MHLNYNKLRLSALFTNWHRVDVWIHLKCVTAFQTQFLPSQNRNQNRNRETQWCCRCWDTCPSVHIDPFKLCISEAGAATHWLTFSYFCSVACSLRYYPIKEQTDLPLQADWSNWWASGLESRSLKAAALAFSSVQMLPVIHGFWVGYVLWSLWGRRRRCTYWWSRWLRW